MAKSHKTRVAQKIKAVLLQYGGFFIALCAIWLTVISPKSEEIFGISTTNCLVLSVVVALIALPIHESRPFKDLRKMTTEKAAYDWHMEDLKKQEREATKSATKKKK